ncbi:MAG: hypothetical protein AB1847_19100 [bacterium]
MNKAWIPTLSPAGAAAEAPGLRSNAFTRMSPFSLLPYDPFTESFPFLSPDPFSAALLYNPLALMFFGPLPPVSTLLPPLPISSAVPVPALPTTVAAGLPMRTAAQTGSWIGTWTSNYIAFVVLWHTGPMSLNIVVDPVLGNVTGTGTLQGSRYADILFNVVGVEANNSISLSGFLGTGYNIYLDGVLTSPTTISGTYTVVGTSGGTILDYGVFNVTLI